MTPVGVNCVLKLTLLPGLRRKRSVVDKHIAAAAIGSQQLVVATCAAWDITYSRLQQL